MNERIKIRQMFETALTNYANSKSPVIPIAYENVVFTPPDSLYLKCFVITGESSNIDMCYSREDVGVFQISVCERLNNFNKNAELIAAEICELFKASNTFSKDGMKVRITKPPYVKQGNLEKDRWCLVVSVFFSSI